MGAERLLRSARNAIQIRELAIVTYKVSILIVYPRIKATGAPQGNAAHGLALSRRGWGLGGARRVQRLGEMQANAMIVWGKRARTPPVCILRYVDVQ